MKHLRMDVRTARYIAEQVKAGEETTRDQRHRAFHKLWNSKHLADQKLGGVLWDHKFEVEIHPDLDHKWYRRNRRATQ